MTTMTAAEIAEVARRAGFQGQDLRIAVAVALAESGGRPGVNAAGSEDSRGLWQINNVHFGDLDEDRLYEPFYNARAAHRVWEESKGFRSDPWDAWSTYSAGLHKAYMDDAARAVARLRNGGGGGTRTGRPQGLQPWRLPRRPFHHGSRRIRVDGDRMQALARTLTDLLATVDAVYHRCLRERDDLGTVNLADDVMRRKLKRKLDEALDDWDGLRRLPHLMSRDIGYVVECWRRFSDADRGEARTTIESLVTSLNGRHGSGTRKHVGALLRALYGPDRSPLVGRHLPTSPRRRDHSPGQAHGPRTPERVTLRALAEVARRRFNLTIREFRPYDDVDPVHTSTSWHYRNRAFDAGGSTRDMARFADWVADQHGGQLKELFWNGPGARNIKNGERVGRWFVGGHTDHVHVAL